MYCFDSVFSSASEMISVSDAEAELIAAKVLSIGSEAVFPQADNKNITDNNKTALFFISITLSIIIRFKKPYCFIFSAKITKRTPADVLFAAVLSAERKPTLLAAALADKGHTIGTLGYSGVSLVCAYLNGLERAVMLVCEIVLAA